MQEAEEGGSSTRNDLLQKLKDLNPLQSQGALAELAYRRAREALEKALADASRIRLDALSEARDTRERELNLLMESLKALRESAESQARSLLESAEVEAEQVRERARTEARDLTEAAQQEQQMALAEARAVREAAEARAREVEKLEADFNAAVARFAERVGMTEPPPEKGWFGKLFR